MFAVPRRPEPPTRSGVRFYTTPIPELPAMLVRDTQEAGEVLRYRTPAFSMYFFDHAPTIEEIFVAKARSFHKGRAVKRLRPLLGRGLLTAEAPEHLRNRRLAQPAFHRRRIDAYGEAMVALTLSRCGTWRDGAEIAVEQESYRLALDIVSHTLFGDALTDAETHDIATGLELMMGMAQFAIVPFSEIFEYLPVPITLRFRRGKKMLHRIIDRMLHNARTRGDGGDFLSMMLAARYDDGQAMSDRQIRDEALTILLAGHETTANAIAWTMEALGRHPEAEARLREELKRVIGERDVRAADLPELPMLRAVVTEAMRLYPPAWIIGRRAIADVELHGYLVRKGNIVFASPFVTQRNPKYFDEPGKFEPERWLRGADVPRFAYFPFGGGNRLCIGEGFAWTESMLVVATLLQRVRLEPLDDLPVPLAPSITLRPGKPIRRRVHRLPALVV